VTQSYGSTAAKAARTARPPKITNISYLGCSAWLIKPGFFVEGLLPSCKPEKEQECIEKENAMFRKLKVISIKVSIIAMVGIIFSFTNAEAISGSVAESGINTMGSSEESLHTAPIAATVGTAVSLAIVLAIGLYVYSSILKDQNALFHLKYGSLLIDVCNGAYEPPAPIIDVTSIDHLATLADRYGTMILHIPRDFLQDYLVQTEQATYRYSLNTEAKVV